MGELWRENNEGDVVLIHPLFNIYSFFNDNYYYNYNYYIYMCVCNLINDDDDEKNGIGEINERQNRKWLKCRPAY